MASQLGIAACCHGLIITLIQNKLMQVMLLIFLWHPIFQPCFPCFPLLHHLMQIKSFPSCQSTVLIIFFFFFSKYLTVSHQSHCFFSCTQHLVTFISFYILLKFKLLSIMYLLLIKLLKINKDFSQSFIWISFYAVFCQYFDLLALSMFYFLSLHIYAVIISHNFLSRICLKYLTTLCCALPRIAYAFAAIIIMIIDLMVMFRTWLKCHASCLHVGHDCPFHTYIFNTMWWSQVYTYTDFKVLKTHFCGS